MLLRRKVRAWLVLGLLPAGAMALGLGDIRLRSALNAPLDADIELSATAEELSGLKASLASRDTFARYGLDYPAFLSTATVLPAKATDGRDVLRIRTAEVVTEPFITLLVEVNWARGRSIREYTVLMDPPVFAEQTSDTALAAPVAAVADRSGSVQRAAVAPPASSSGGSSSGSPAGGGGSYQVRNGDTLSAIARSQFPNSPRERALVAIYRANPAAFDGNMNELRAGAQLALPAESDLGAVGPGEASAEVSRQYQAWVQGRGTSADAGQLRLVPPQDPAVTGAGAGAGDAALQQRVEELQRQLAEAQRALEVRNAELARLQAQVGGSAAATAPAPADVTPPADATTSPAEPAVPEPAEATPAAPPAAAAAPTPPPPVEEASEGTIFDWLIDRWYYLLGAIAVFLAGVFGLRAWRVRQEQSFDQSLDRLSGATFERAASSTATLPIRSLPDTDDSILVEESGTSQRPRFTGLDEGIGAKPAAKSVKVDDTVSGDTAVGLEQGDPLAEADFHMAYGLYDQAADLVRLAIAREPQRRDLKLKLLEVFFVWGNKDQFLPLARDLANSRAESLPGEWEKIIIMGRQIAPEDALFSTGGALPGAASAGVDLNLEGGQNRVDFDLLGEPTIAPANSDGIDLDLGAALGDKPTAAEAASLSADAGVDFVLDDPDRGADATGSTREMPEAARPAHTITMELSGFEGDAPTVEQPQLEQTDHPTIRQKLDLHARQGLAAAGDQTAELALDDLGLDLGTIESPAVKAGDLSAEAPTVLTNVEEETRLLQARRDSDLALSGESPQLTPSASGTWLFTDVDASAVMPSPGTQATQQMPAATEVIATLSPKPDEDDSTSMTGRLRALKASPGEMDLDLGDPDATGTRGAANGAGLDLDFGQAPPNAEPGFSDTARLAATDSALPDLEPPTMSEVGTKLDLARAYMDMGDPEGARSILDEVLNEGSASQKQEARRLIESLPG